MEIREKKSVETSLANFKKEIIKEWALEPFWWQSSDIEPTPSQKKRAVDPTAQEIVNHQIQSSPKKKKCAVCEKNHKREGSGAVPRTYKYCSACGIHLHQECWETFHLSMDFFVPDS